MNETAAQIEAVVFDMDGTLFDSATAVPDAYIATMRELSGVELTPPEVFARYPLGPPINILRDLHGEHADEGHVATYHGHLRASSASCSVYDGIPELLHQLRARNVKIGVFTGADTTSCTMLVEATGLARHFDTDTLCGTDLVGRPKPDPAGLLFVCDRLGVAPERTAYVGDSPLDMQAALRAGCVAVSAGWGHLHDPAEPCHMVAARPEDVLDVLQR